MARGISVKKIYAGKTVAVLGLGRFGGGLDSARFAYNCGANVIVTDSAKPEKLAGAVKELADCKGMIFRIGSHEKADFEKADLVIVNPAVPPTNELIAYARSLGKTITSQVELFFAMSPAKIVGITGANGKSTTTALAAHLLRAGIGQEGFPYRKVWLGGNIGNQPLLCNLDDIRPDDLGVLELSSFQLEQLANSGVAPHASLITNLAPNHLDRHGTYENYAAAKENIFRFQKCDPKNPVLSVFNAKDEIGLSWYKKYKADKGRVCELFAEDDVTPAMREAFPLPGWANRQNLAGALHIARFFGVTDASILKTLADFKGLPHRIELVRKLGGVAWYNDSIATTPESVMVALDAFECPRIVIAGGYDKKLPFDELGRRMAKQAKAVVLIGVCAEKIKKAVLEGGGKPEMLHMAGNSMAEAVRISAQLAAPGDVVLMSPACASYDMFENFEHRAQVFRDLVAALPAS
jgi:UDP-N-acetylmuramoylalanine--D-glutamate ligase